MGGCGLDSVPFQTPHSSVSENIRFINIMLFKTGQTLWNPHRQVPSECLFLMFWNVKMADDGNERYFCSNYLSHTDILASKYRIFAPFSGLSDGTYKQNWFQFTISNTAIRCSCMYPLGGL